MNKTITIPRIAFKQIELSTNTLITILFLLLTFFIGYVNTTLNSRMDKLDNKIERLQTQMNANNKELQTKITNVEKQIIEIRANQQIILNHIKRK